MFQKSCLSLLVILLLSFACTRDKKPLEPEKPTVIPSTMPQDGIPWPSLADSPWPMSTVNPQGIARSPFLGPREGKVLWAKQLENAYKASQGGPALGADGTVYFSLNGNPGGPGFVALSSSGQIKWKLSWDSNSRFDTGPVIAADSTIYVAGTVLSALAPDGTTKWTFRGETGFAEIRPLLGIDGTIFLKDFHGNIYAITPSGRIRWQKSMGQTQGLSYISMSPDGSAIYTAGKDSTLIALNASDGALLWSVKTNLFLYAGPAVDSQGNVYFYSADRNNGRFLCSVSCLGAPRWLFQVDGGWGSPYGGITIDQDGQIYFGWLNRGIFALDYGGRLRWKLAFPEGYTDCPIISDVARNLYVLNVLSPKIWCFSSVGTFQFSAQVAGWPESQLFPSAIGKDGVMYLGSSSPWIAAIK